MIGRVAPWAEHDYDSALLQVRLYHALGQRGPWAKALAQARALAGERDLPADVARCRRATDTSLAAAHAVERVRRSHRPQTPRNGSGSELERLRRARASHARHRSGSDRSPMYRRSA